ncbi:unnamed protein product [Hymenolepis diminuta]|uniref:Uncharacterized protein n=1 Tax=Hymenolepis diminuta TaxID=6216 RepID=A0A564ZCK5_HYMDI|nr:unnamed protein product [Hymenolepis diminuta]
MEITSSSGSGKTAAGQLLRESSAAASAPTTVATATTTTRPASALAASSNSFTAHPQPPKRPSLVQELSVPPSEPDSLPLPPPPPPTLLSSPSSSSSNVDFQTFFGASFCPIANFVRRLNLCFLVEFSLCVEVSQVTNIGRIVRVRTRGQAN